jgi:hypothetical protein
VAPSLIVERFDVFGNVGVCNLAISVDFLLDDFFLQAAEERFGNRIVPAIAASTHTGLEMIGSAEAPPIVASILRPLVRVNDRSVRASPPHCHQDRDAEYAAALAAGRIEAEIEIRAQAVRYVPERDAIEIVTNHNAGFLIPRQWIGALQDVPTEELGKLEVWPDGSAIELEDRDIQISVHGLLTAILPAMLPSRSVAAIFASRGGQATSRAKRKSSRANGRKGGRPRKKSSTEIA